MIISMYEEQTRYKDMRDLSSNSLITIVVTHDRKTQQRTRAHSAIEQWKKCNSIFVFSYLNDSWLRYIDLTYKRISL